MQESVSHTPDTLQVDLHLLAPDGFSKEIFLSGYFCRHIYML